MSDGFLEDENISEDVVMDYLDDLVKAGAVSHFDSIQEKFLMSEKRAHKIYDAWKSKHK